MPVLTGEKERPAPHPRSAEKHAGGDLAVFAVGRPVFESDLSGSRLPEPSALSVRYRGVAPDPLKDHATGIYPRAAIGRRPRNPARLRRRLYDRRNGHWQIHRCADWPPRVYPN